MRIIIESSYKIEKFIINDNKEDFFTYSYKLPNQEEDFLFSFEKKDNKWYLKDNGVVSAIGSLNKEITPYKSFDVKILGHNDLITLWALPEEESNLYNLSTDNVNEITIGTGKTVICYRYSEIAPLELSIKKIDNKYILQVINDKKYRVYLNNIRVSSSKELKTGDVIFIEGLIIIWMNSFITINNPNNAIGVTGMQPYNMPESLDNTNVEPVSDEAQNFKLYSDDDYFFHIPRIREIIEREDIIIDAPPSPIGTEDMPWYLKIGTSITMGVSTLVMSFNVINNIRANADMWRIVPQILMIIAMIIGTLVFPRLMDRWKKKHDAIKEKKRVEKYTEYLNEKEKEIILKNKQIVQILNDNNLPSSACKTIAVTPNNRNFWSREIISNDFLTVRLGLGTIESPLVINAPEKKFQLDTDVLLTRVYEMSDKYKNISNVPITISLLEKNISAFICSGIDKYEYFKNIIIQLVALHSGADLKIVIFTNEDNEEKWEFTKFLPHCWSEDKKNRLFASNNDEIKAVSLLLENEFKQRKEIVDGSEKLKDENDEVVKVNEKNAYSSFSCYYLIICDNYKNNFRIPIVDSILKTNTNSYGFSFTILTNTLKNLPAKCDTFIEIGQNDGCVLSRDISSKNQSKFIVENDKDINLREICNTLINIPLIPKDGIRALPQSLSFLEMYGISKVEQLNVLNRWKTNNPVVSLSAPIGVYSNGDIFKLDLHEKFHGPHGLIAGTTGSGKSEFIISYILSMCVNYHPYEVQFVLIDYKGGGLAGAFENRELGTSIPHLAGTITNLDTASMNRTLVSIQSELKRRQNIFNQTRDSLEEGTVDIYKYQKFYREGIVKEPLPHLFIISDEFAELKAQQPDFMSELISTARIGRSLGVHLILATQKPSGVVNDQIWSNSKFKVCLKVQDRSDSMEVLRKPDAAYIKEAGRFYLQVGNDDFYDKGQSGWSGAKYVPSDRLIKKIDDSISFINNTGDIIKSIKDIVINDGNNTENYGDQLTNIVKYITTLGKKENIVTKKLWLDAIPDTIFVSNLIKKYNYKREPYVINPILGEYDSPSTQEQKILTFNFNNSGNLLMVGKQGSGKENLLTTMILSSVIDHTPDEVNFYIIDCGTEALRIFNKMPHVGEIAFVEDSDLIFEIFSMVAKEIERRKELMSDYAGSYNEFIRDSNQKLPLIVTIINNFDVFSENYSNYTDSLNQLFRDGPRYGVCFVISAIAPNAVRGRMAQNFVRKFILQLQDNSQYRNEYGAPRGLVPSQLFGRGIAYIDDKFYEFQTAYVVKKTDINKFIRESSKSYSEAYTTHAKKVAVVPSIVYDKKMYDKITDLENVPIGYNIQTKEISYYNFNQNYFNPIITSNMDLDKMSFIYALIKMISKIKDVNVKVIDFAECIEKEIENVDVFNKDFDKAIIDMNNNIIKNKDSKEKNVYFILGVGMYKKLLSDNGKIIINKLFSNAELYDNSRFIIVDVLISFKSLLSDEWYQKNFNSSSGIWLDPDVTNQVIINAPNVSLEDRKVDFQYISFQITNNKHVIVKHMIEESENE